MTPVRFNWTGVRERSRGILQVASLLYLTHIKSKTLHK